MPPAAYSKLTLGRIRASLVRSILDKNELVFYSNLANRVDAFVIPSPAKNVLTCLANPREQVRAV